jgi:hypothetical protein
MKVFSKALQGKIFLITSVTICVLVGIFFIIEFNHDKKILYERQIMHMKEASHTVRNSIESVRIPLLIQSILDEYAQNIFTLYDTDHSDSGNTSEKEAHQLHVVNTDSIIMASTKSEYIGLPLEEAILHKEEGLNKVLKGVCAHSGKGYNYWCASLCGALFETGAVNQGVFYQKRPFCDHVNCLSQYYYQFFLI